MFCPLGGEGIGAADPNEGREWDGCQVARERHPWEARYHCVSAQTVGRYQNHQLGDVHKVTGM